MEALRTLAQRGHLSIALTKRALGLQLFLGEVLDVVDGMRHLIMLLLPCVGHHLHVKRTLVSGPQKPGFWRSCARARVSVGSPEAG